MRNFILFVSFLMRAMQSKSFPFFLFERQFISFKREVLGMFGMEGKVFGDVWNGGESVWGRLEWRGKCLERRKGTSVLKSR